MNNTTTTENTKPVISREQLRMMRGVVNGFLKAQNGGFNWKKHLEKLSDSCDTLDAVMARAGVNAIEVDGKKIKTVIETAADQQKAGEN